MRKEGYTDDKIDTNNIEYWEMVVKLTNDFTTKHNITHIIEDGKTYTVSEWNESVLKSAKDDIESARKREIV